MPLSVAEQLMILGGSPKPEAGSLMDMIHQISINEITSKSGNKITFTVDDQGVYALPGNVPPQLLGYWSQLPDAAKDQTALKAAYSYQDKMVRFSQRVSRGDDQVKKELQRTVVSFLSADSDMADFVDDAAWAEKILSVITRTFELLAETTSEEQLYFKALIPPGA